MNNYGVILNDIGLEPLMSALQDLFKPVAEAKFAGAGAGFDSHHTFIVQYEPGKDVNLRRRRKGSTIRRKMASVRT